MSSNLLLALAAFSLVSSITPGPNNLMLMASGANFGFGRSLPHMMGVTIGFTFMVFVVGIGLASAFDAYPAAHDVLKVISVAYLLYLAWKIANASGPGERSAAVRPMTFLQAAAFQWVNPKAWAMALTAISVYSPDHGLAAALFTALVFGVINLPSVSIWVVAGRELRRFLTSPVRLRTFNVAMALLLVATLYPVIFPR